MWKSVRKNIIDEEILRRPCYSQLSPLFHEYGENEDDDLLEGEKDISVWDEIFSF